jgi:hypothetical protein
MTLPLLNNVTPAAHKKESFNQKCSRNSSKADPASMPARSDYGREFAERITEIILRYYYIS